MAGMCSAVNCPAASARDDSIGGVAAASTDADAGVAVCSREEWLNASLVRVLQLHGCVESDEHRQRREIAMKRLRSRVRAAVVAASAARGVAPQERHDRAFGASLIPFGSYCLGVHVPSSDVDVFVSPAASSASSASFQLVFRA